MAMERLLFVGLRGELPQARLDALRDRLGLHRQGRLTDHEDELFGYRYLRDAPGERTVVRLSRQAADRWAIHLASEGTRPAQEVIDGWRSAVEEAATHLDLVVDQVRQY
jgi:hypothetical protein